MSREQIDRRDDLAHKIREAWQAPGVIRYDSDDEWRMAVAAADVAGQEAETAQGGPAMPPKGDRHVVPILGTDGCNDDACSIAAHWEAI